MGTADGAFAGLAGQAGEECRVERALRELGHPLSDIYRRKLTPMSEDYARAIKGPFWDYQRSWDPDDLEPLLGAATQGLDHLLPLVAYVVGDDIGAGSYNPPVALDGPGRWAREGYLALYEPMSTLPAATTACPREELDELLMAVERALKG